jgi:hypothetical protein
MSMPRRREPQTAREKVLAVARWAHAAGFNNIAAALHDALALMPDDGAGRIRRRVRR